MEEKERDTEREKVKRDDGPSGSRCFCIPPACSSEPHDLLQTSRKICPHTPTHTKTHKHTHQASHFRPGFMVMPVFSPKILENSGSQ